MPPVLIFRPDFYGLTMTVDGLTHVVTVERGGAGCYGMLRFLIDRVSKKSKAYSKGFTTGRAPLPGRPSRNPRIEHAYREPDGKEQRRRSSTTWRTSTAQ